jgi:hypothetical protein
MTTPYAGVDFISPVRIDEFGYWIMYTKMAMTTELYLDKELAPKENGKYVVAAL